ncbi:VanW family protein [Streptomyces litchfieldiae]|uniref:VanW family protein n=1 Tax=Streptomyces litchfieldiae TaxID=3075543 RepID=A0ABU2MUR8_9ACTN|nr:VanW family protein [Streptomyces sp. DSM 44938]MDT0345393.1 VanW family protein [Streptomyces sp. DSM 44938]
MAVIPPPPAEPPRIPGPHRAPGVSPFSRLSRVPLPALVGGGLAVGAGGLFLVGSLLVGGEIAPGTSVHGVDIGGLSPAAARELLGDELAGVQAEPMEVLIGEESEEVHELDPAAAGLTVDIAATVDRAERPGLLGRLFGGDGGELEPVVRQDEEAGRAELSELAEASDTTVREGAVAFEDGAVAVTEPRPGTELDVAASLGLLRDGFLARVADGDGAGPVRLPVHHAQPRTDAAEVDRVVREFAEPAMSGPVVLTAGDARIVVPPEVLGDHLRLDADDEGRLEPALDGAGLADDERLAGPIEDAAVEPTDATLRLAGGEVVASGGAPGSRVDRDAIGETVWPLLTERGEAARTAPVATEPVEAELTADNYRDLGIVEQMSTFTVNFDPAPYRTTNIGRAAELINGSLVPAGEEWSFNDTVGERTEENGFVEGIIILDDQYQQAQGGGVSAVATTMFNAAFFAGVDPVEYGAHSFYIERYPAGREATVAWGSLDLRFLNDSGNALYVLADATDTSVTVTFLGTKRYDEVRAEAGPRENVQEPGRREGEGEDCVPQPPLEGFDIDVDRVFVDGGREVGRETFTTHYVPRDEVVCRAGEE